MASLGHHIIKVLLAIGLCAFGVHSGNAQSLKFDYAFHNCKLAVVVPAEYFAGQERSLFANNISDFWSPRQQDIIAAESKLKKFIEEKISSKNIVDATKSVLRTILETHSNQRRQIVGFVFDEKKFVHFNFLPKSENVASNWREHYVVSTSSQGDFWSVNYRLEDGQFCDLFLQGKIVGNGKESGK